MKIGRNDPCYCGNGKKYKKCHLNRLPEVIKIIKEISENKVEENEMLRSKGIYVNYVNPVMFKGRKAWALGSKVYLRNNPNETFHDFLQFILKEEILGLKWISEQKSLPENEQHFLIKCFTQFDKFKEKLIMGSNREKILSASPNGWVKCMITLAFDVATLKQSSDLPEFLVKRLRVPLEYQGARYEILVAAIIARLGFKISWLDERERGEPHCEFIATHIETGTKIAVEAKSRHRQGVLHTPGISKGIENYKGDVQHLLNDALKKIECGKMPFLIFIDVNAPIKHSENFQEIPWIKDILKKARQTEPNLKDKPSKYNAIYFTNLSFHYDPEKEDIPGQNLQSLPQFTLFPVPEPKLYPAILNALQYYGYIPDIKEIKTDN